MTGTRRAPLSPQCDRGSQGLWGQMGWALQRPWFLQPGGKSEKWPQMCCLCALAVQLLGVGALGHAGGGTSISSLSAPAPC